VREFVFILIKDFTFFPELLHISKLTLPLRLDKSVQLAPANPPGLVGARVCGRSSWYRFVFFMPFPQQLLLIISSQKQYSYYTKLLPSKSRLSLRQFKCLLAELKS